MLTISDFVELLVDDCQEVEIYDCESDKTVYKGEACDIPSKYDYEDITSIDPVRDNIIVLNICFQGE